MTDQWMLKGRAFSNCNCATGCPCQFSAPSTHGFCQAITNIMIDEGNYDDIPLAGLSFIGIFKWPGEIAEGNGEGQLIICDSATPEQKEAVIKIATGVTTEPGATHFSVFASTLTKFHPILDAPIEMEIDVDARTCLAKIAGISETEGKPLIDPFSGEETRALIHLPNGFEYTFAEMGVGNTNAKSDDIELTLTESYGQFNTLHMNQSGVIRD